MLSDILGVSFFSSKSAEFLHVASDSLEKHCSAFFSARLSFFCKKKRMQKKPVGNLCISLLESQTKDIVHNNSNGKYDKSTWKFWGVYA